MLRLRASLAVLTALCLGTTASAATLDGVTLPDSYPVQGATLHLNGIGVRTLSVFAVRIYVAGLYLEHPSHDASQILASPEPKIIILQYLHAGSKQEVEKEYRAGEMTNCGSGGCAASDKDDFERLVAAAPAVKVGDTSTYIISQNGLRVLANNRDIGTYNNRDLGMRLLAGFIGERPPSQELRTALLGLAQR